MPHPKLTAEQQALADKLGLDWSKIPWTQLLSLLLAFLQQQKPAMTAAAGCCDHTCCAHASFQASLETTRLTAEHYCACCEQHA